MVVLCAWETQIGVLFWIEENWGLMVHRTGILQTKK
jgi:hypothetical protein